MYKLYIIKGEMKRFCTREIPIESPAAAIWDTIRGKGANWQCFNASMNTYEGDRNEMADAKTK